jgi:hypothetical protein
MPKFVGERRGCRQGRTCSLAHEQTIVRRGGCFPTAVPGSQNVGEQAIERKRLMGNSPLMTLPEFAEMVNTPINTVRHWRAIGYGPKTAGIGRRVMVRRAEAEEWLARQFATEA